MGRDELGTYINLLRKGEVVAFPTETVYGLGADAWNPSAVKKIFALKGRPTDNPLIVHISETRELFEFSEKIPKTAHKLIQHFWPGPLTFILPKRSDVLDLVTGGLSTVAVRMPDNETALKLIRGAGPLAAPSANKSGRPSPTTPRHVKADFGDLIPVAGTKPTKIGLESTVLDITQTPFQILRPGAVTRSQIEQVTQKSVILDRPKINNKTGQTRSPGTKYTHYSPKANVRWLRANEETVQPRTLYIFHTRKHPLFDKIQDQMPGRLIHFNGHYFKMGRELYDWFRKADNEGYKTIAVEPFSEKVLNEKEITEALKNRISKAIGG